MFKLTPNPTFIAAVPVSIPGQEKPVSIQVEFKHLDRKGIQAFFDPEHANGKSDVDLLSEIVTGWRGVDAEYSKDNLQTMLDNYPTAALSFFETFRKELLESRAKN